MLKLGRKAGESIVTNGPCEISFDRTVKVGIDAPMSTKILRGELADAERLRRTMHPVFDQSPSPSAGSELYRADKYRDR